MRACIMYITHICLSQSLCLPPGPCISISFSGFEDCHSWKSFCVENTNEGGSESDAASHLGENHVPSCFADLEVGDEFWNKNHLDIKNSDRCLFGLQTPEVETRGNLGVAASCQNHMQLHAALCPQNPAESKPHKLPHSRALFTN